jgi:hypothetical protein
MMMMMVWECTCTCIVLFVEVVPAWDPKDRFVEHVIMMKAKSTRLI